MTTGFSAAPARRLRWKWLVWGIVAAVLGVLAMIGGGITMAVGAVADAGDAAAELRTPEPVTFTATAGSYRVMYVDERFDPHTAADFACRVTRADESVVEFDGSFQTVSTTVNNDESIGSFDAVAGRTTVDCDAAGEQGSRIIVVTGGFAGIGWWILIGGGVSTLIGVGLILAAVIFRRRVDPPSQASQPYLQPYGPPDPYPQQPPGPQLPPPYLPG